MSRLYLLGGRQKERIFRHEEEWNLYESALILEIDTESGEVRTCVEYQTPQEARPDETWSPHFKSGTLVGDTLYVCTSTEVLLYHVPDFQRLNYVSLPCFNDLHHVTPTRSGDTLLAVSTGLDMVVRFTPQGEVIEVWDVLEEQPWTRFSRDIDYRKVGTTKPHRSHPNFVFELNQQIWVTRFKQRDALCLTDRRKQIDIGVESPHDGIICGDYIYFTVVDGRLITARASSLAVESIIDLKVIDNPNSLLGWCRGVLPITESTFWVGFTGLRETRFKRNVHWVKRIFKDGMTAKPTHISLYDVTAMQCLQEIDLARHGMHVIFSILPAPCAQTQ